MIKQILIDAREFVPEKKTGIGRFLEGLLNALIKSDLAIEVVLASPYKDSVPSKIRNNEKIKIEEIPRSFLLSERALSDLSKQRATIFISPYPKLPFFGVGCPSINTIHDVLYLTHDAYETKLKVFFDRLILKRALKKASLTWYVSSWSLRETEEYIGITGNKPVVRHNPIDVKFRHEGKKEHKSCLAPGYILVVGNGLPHKNLGVLLNNASNMSRKFVFIGVSKENQTYWKSKYPDAKGIWIEYVQDEELPSLIKASFCLAQPSIAEGFGYPPLEAMACGVPAVVSNIPVLVETTGGNAIIADPNNSDTWFKAFNMLEDKHVYENQINKGLKWVEPLQGPSGWSNHITDIESFL